MLRNSENDITQTQKSKIKKIGDDALNLEHGSNR